MNKLIAAAALGTALIAGPSVAQDAAPKPRPDLLALADADKDGTVTKDELLASVATHFKKVDANGDGKITAEERKAGRDGPRGHMGRRGGHRMRGGPDADRDGAVTLAEQQAQAVRRFDWVDGNKDGKVDQAERAAMRDKMTAMRGPGGPGGPGRGMHVNPDTNGDGVVTLEESQAQTKRRFDLVDANKDGKIDQAERAAVRGKMMAMRGHGRWGHHGRRGPPPPPPADGPDAPNGE